MYYLFNKFPATNIFIFYQSQLKHTVCRILSLIIDIFEIYASKQYLLLYLYKMLPVFKEYLFRSSKAYTTLNKVNKFV